MKKSNLKKMVLLTLALGSMWTVPGLAAAEEMDKASAPEVALDEVVVTANRMENKLVDTPANVSVVSSEEISRRNYQNAIEAVKDVPGVSVQEGARGDDSIITIGGSDRVLVLVDGRRVGSDQGFSSSKAKIDVGMLPNTNSIERIEILKGGASTVYGADAVGGVINIITKSAGKNYITLDANTGSWGTQNYKGVISQKSGKTGIWLAASKEKQNYFKYKENSSSSNLRYPNSSLEKIAVNMKLDQELTEGQLLTLTYDHLNKKGGRPGGLSYINPDHGHKIDNNVALKYTWDRNTSNSGFVQVYRNNSVNDWSNQMKTEEDKLGFDVQQNIRTSRDNALVVGASYYKSDVDTRGFNSYDRSINNKAVFVQDSWDFAPTWKLNTGIRYDNHSEAGSKTTGSVAVNKKFNENSHAYVSWSQIFNAPTTDDLFYYVDYGMWGKYLGNKDLKPEKGDIWTIGYESKIGRKSNVSVSAFYSELEDAIRWNYNYNDGNTYAENIDKQKRRGFEVDYKYTFDDNWSAYASYAYVKVENKQYTPDYVRDANIVPNQYKFGVGYNGKRLSADVYARGGSGAAEASYVDSKYLTLDLSVNYKIKDNWKLYVKGYNLTNASYAQSAGVYNNNYKYPAPGRAFLIGTEFTF